MESRRADLQHYWGTTNSQEVMAGELCPRVTVEFVGDLQPKKKEAPLTTCCFTSSLSYHRVFAVPTISHLGRGGTAQCCGRMVEKGQRPWLPARLQLSYLPGLWPGPQPLLSRWRIQPVRHLCIAALEAPQAPRSRSCLCLPSSQQNGGHLADIPPAQR